MSVAAITSAPTVATSSGSTVGPIEAFTHGMCPWLRSNVDVYKGTGGDNGEPLCACETLEAPGFRSTCQKNFGTFVGVTFAFGFRHTFDPCDDSTGLFKFEYLDGSAWNAMMEVSYSQMLTSHDVA